MGYLDDATLPPREQLPRGQRLALAAYHVNGTPLPFRLVTIMGLIADGFLELVPPNGRGALTEKGVNVCRREIVAADFKKQLTARDNKG